MMLILQMFLSRLEYEKILLLGDGLGVGIGDVSFNDGWADIYLCNDFRKEISCT